jgi:hypothetical protein
MIGEIVDLSDHRPPVVYTVHLVQFWDGRLECKVEDVADDLRSREAVRETLRRVLKYWDDVDNNTTMKGV